MNDGTAIDGTPGIVCESQDIAALRDVAERMAGGERATAVALHVDHDVGGLVRALGPTTDLRAMATEVPDASVYEVRSRRLRRHRVTWGLGEATPGVSMVFHIRRRSGMSVPDFHRHWRDSHGPVALSHHLGMWDYDQLSVVGGDDPDLDGIAVVSFPTAADASQRFFDTAAGAEVVRADAAAFTDGATLRRRLTTEYVLKDDTAAAAAWQDWAHHRSLELPAPAEEVWDLVGDFGALLEWWPGGLASISTDAGPPVTRRLVRADGTAVVESLVHHRPAEHMLQLAVEEGFPEGVADYTCRYEIRPAPDGCRLDWSPRASVAAGAEGTFAAIVDGGWSQIVDGLRSRFGV